jgi:hypothetical protein
MILVVARSQAPLLGQTGEAGLGFSLIKQLADGAHSRQGQPDMSGLDTIIKGRHTFDYG